MPKVSPLQSNFNGGEFSPLIYGRIDLDRYRTGLAVCLNYIPTAQGGLTRRPATAFVAETKFSARESRLIRFEFSTTQAYMLEFGHQYIRFFKDNAIITLATTNITGATAANPVVITSNAHGYSNGDRIVITGVSGMVQLNNREFIVANVAANTYELKDVGGTNINGTAYTAYTSGGVAGEIYEVATNYNEVDLFQLRFTQSADVLYIVHGGYQPAKLTRTAHTTWTLTTMTILDGPYLNTNTTATTLTPSGTTGTITITASASLWDGVNDIGRVVRIKHGSTWGYARIVAPAVNATIANATVVNPFGATTASATWRIGLWSGTLGYPAVVTFHEDRLFFGGSPSYPQRFDGSRSGDYENFAPTDTDGTVSDSHSVGFNLNSNDVNVIRWLVSDEKGLLAGSVAGEWIIRPSTQGEALSPTNISAKKTTAYGSADVEPVQVGKACIFVQRHNRKVREINYIYTVDGFVADDITILAEHVSAGGFVQLAYQKEPQPIVWCVRGDGVLVGVTYERSNDELKVAWHRHILGGDSDAGGTHSKVESVSVIPSPDGTSDEPWVIVKRYINGGVKRYVEHVTQIFEETTEQKDAFFVDSGLTYDNPKTITGATQANPVVITSATHGFSNGDVVLISDVLGMTDLNTNTYTVANVAANTFELSGVNGTAYGTYVSGGEVRKYITSISGLFHLEGQSVDILADGAVQPSKTVTAGAITLSERSTTVQVGLGYNSDAQILRIEAGSADGVALGKTRRIHRMGLLLYRSLGLAIGTDFDNLTDLTFRKTSDLFSRAVPLYTGILSETLEADYDFDNQFCFRQDQPLPSTVLAIMAQMVTEDRG